MKTQIRVKQAGTRIRDPKSGALLEYGKVYSVDYGQYWMRRLGQDLIEVVLEKEPLKTKKQEGKTE